MKGSNTPKHASDGRLLAKARQNRQPFFFVVLLRIQAISHASASLRRPQPVVTYLEIY
jgi:hypothetical protein